MKRRNFIATCLAALPLAISKETLLPTSTNNYMAETVTFTAVVGMKLCTFDDGKKLIIVKINDTEITCRN